jgi:CBS domain containing-hemolysin-like protein
MTLLAVCCALLAMSLAALCAYADGALLALEDDEPPSSPRVADLLARREAVHRALAFGRIVGQLLAGAAVAVALRAAAVPASELTAVAVAIGIVVIAVTEIVARTAGDSAGVNGVARCVEWMHGIERIFAPVVFFGSRFDAALLRLLPIRVPDAEEREEHLEQFREVVAAEAEAEPDSPASVLLHGVFSLGDTVVQAIMVPRVDIVGIERETSWSEVVDKVRSARHARLPVYDGTIDEIVGVLYAKDLLPSIVDDVEPEGGWTALVRPPVFIPGTKSVDEQLREFRSTHRHIAIVVDEYGGTAGLVTMEDALELIVGEIRDEHDIEEPDVEQEGEDRWWVAAGVSLDELSEIVGADFHREDVQTVGGLVTELLGRVPRNGERMTVGEFRVVVERVVRRRVERVYFERVVPVTGGGES